VHSTTTTKSAATHSTSALTAAYIQRFSARIVGVDLQYNALGKLQRVIHFYPKTVDGIGELRANIGSINGAVVNIDGSCNI
jgi:hypothetical protein